MNVGIITFINTTNFGASLQAFALQNTLLKLGVNAEIIKYTNRIIEEKENVKGGFSIRSIIRKIVMGAGVKKKANAFRKFESQNINFGKVLNDETKNEINEYYDFFITGSDQVWNMSITHRDWWYFLEFVKDNEKKISYAPSFGNVSFPEECYDRLKKNLKEFHSLSIRESAGKEFLKSHFGLEAELVVDPTLLLDKKEWIKNIQFKPSYKHYILVYFPHDKKKVFKFVNELKIKTGYEVVYLSISPRKQQGVTTIYDASPDEFLGWILNADYVVTGSFHGTAFSLNFEKQFFYEPSGTGSRIDSLVRLCGVIDRSIDNQINLNRLIDYSSVRNKLQLERDSSLKWLKGSLMGGKCEES